MVFVVVREVTFSTSVCSVTDCYLAEMEDCYVHRESILQTPDVWLMSELSADGYTQSTQTVAVYDRGHFSLGRTLS